jgi:hypothetical protein
MFNGRELLDPGLVLVSHWPPDGGQPHPNAARVMACGGDRRGGVRRSPSDRVIGATGPWPRNHEHPPRPVTCRSAAAAAWRGREAC